MIKAAIVGTGMIANAGHIPAWANIADRVKLVAVNFHTEPGATQRGIDAEPRRVPGSIGLIHIEQHFVADQSDVVLGATSDDRLFGLFLRSLPADFLG